MSATVQYPQPCLSMTIGGVRLHLPDDDVLTGLADAAARPDAVLPHDRLHFVSWLEDREPAEIRKHLVTSVRDHRDLRRRPGWTLDLAVVVEDEVVGLQSLAGFDRWPRRRNVGTSSWLLARWQGRGIGTLARAAVLDLAFGPLAAQAAMSWACPGNAASTAVSHRLGYRLVDAADPADPRAEAKYRLDRSQWRTRRPPALPATHILDAARVVAELTGEGRG